MTSRVACITGVGRKNGIGRALALRLAEDGWDIAFSYWSPYEERMSLGGAPSDPADIAKEIRATGRRVLALEGDLADPATPARLLAEANATLGPVSALVLSHSESVDSTILDTTIESFDRHFAVNVRAAWLLIAAFADRSSRRRSDRRAHQRSRRGEPPVWGEQGRTRSHRDRRSTRARPARHSGERPEPGPDRHRVDDRRNARTWNDPAADRPIGNTEGHRDVVSFLVSPKGPWISGQLLKSDGGFSVLDDVVAHPGLASAHPSHDGVGSTRSAVIVATIMSPISRRCESCSSGSSMSRRRSRRTCAGSRHGSTRTR